MLDVILSIMLAFFLIGTPVLLYASWVDEYFGIIKQPRPKYPQFANWLTDKAQQLSHGGDKRAVVLRLVRN